MLPFLIPYSQDTSICNYLPRKLARLPLYLSLDHVGRSQFDDLMENGFRRSGAFYYNTACSGCSACQPIRLEVEKFKPSRSQRRAAAKSKALELRLSNPTVDAQRVALFNRHRNERNLASADAPVTAQGYSAFLLQARNPSVELSVWLDEKLLAVTIIDVGLNCLSAVYCFFDPSYSQWSLGTVCIMKEVELAKEYGHRWLYLGYYVAANEHLNYKANFRPHQLRVNGAWADCGF